MTKADFITFHFPDGLDMKPYFYRIRGILISFWRSKCNKNCSLIKQYIYSKNIINLISIHYADLMMISLIVRCMKLQNGTTVKKHTCILVDWNNGKETYVYFGRLFTVLI